MGAILIVEDDENLRLALADNLEDEGYEVTAAGDGAAARAAMQARAFDLIILDLMLPDTDGYTLCRELRAAGRQAMVLMLTARSLEEDLVAGFEAGADDYLSKPYRLRELLARVKALLRRAGAVEPPPAPVTFGQFRLDPDARTVSRADQTVVDLTRTEFDLLAFMLSNSGRVLTRDQILDAVWGRDVMIAERTIDNFVSSLKRKLDCKSGDEFAFRTVRGIGYRMERS